MNNTNTTINDEEKFYTEAFSRNLFEKDTQEKLKNSTIAIAGLGAVGGIYSISFARLGVGNFHISDLDVFETVNMNRQLGSTVSSLGQSKTKVTKEIIQSINPFAAVKAFEGGINEENIDDFLTGVDVVLDGMDFFNIKIRRLLYKKAHEHGIYVVGAAPIGYGSALQAFDPKGMGFDEYYNINDSMSENEMILSFALGLAPAFLQRKYFKFSNLNLKDRKATSLMTGVLACGNLATCEAVKVILGQKVRAIPLSSQFDPYVRKYKKVSLRRGNKSIIQRIKIAVVKKMLKKSNAFE